MTKLLPPNNAADIGDLGARGRSALQNHNRERFALLWDDLEGALEQRAWLSSPGSVVELYALPIQQRRVERLWISPTGGRLRLRIDVDSHKIRKEVLTRLTKSREAESFLGPFHEIALKRTAASVHVLEAEATLTNFFRGCRSARAMRKRLKDVVLEVLDAADADAIPAEPYTPDLDIVAALEGDMKLVVHLRRERSSKLRKAKIAAVARAHGKVACEVCDFDFADVYGELGRAFAEVHHISPIAENGSRESTEDDLAVICSNCHRMIHRTKPMWPLSRLRELVRREA